MRSDALRERLIFRVRGLLPDLVKDDEPRDPLHDDFDGEPSGSLLGDFVLL
jgi:hypothetical protein